MTAVEEIHKVQNKVASMQSYLIDTQEVLGVAEEVAMAGTTIKRGIRRLIFVPVVVLGVVALLTIRRKCKMRESKDAGVAETPEPT